MSFSRRIPAAWMRGGTSKGLFFLASDLPASPAERDALLARLLGSPDPYGKQIDGLGGATSSTSKVVLVSRSERPGSDVDYLFGQVAIGTGGIDWSGNCGNLTAAVGPFAIHRGLVAVPDADSVRVRIWQANIGKRIVATVPLADGMVREDGEFRLDGVPFAAAPITLEFLDPAGSDEGALFPSGRTSEYLSTPGGPLAVTLINAGNPMVLAHASALEVDCGTPLAALNRDAALLARCEALRIAASLAMGLADSPETAQRRAHTPKLALLAGPAGFRAADGRDLDALEVDLLCRVLSMGAFHHAIPGTAAIAIATAAAIPGTLAAELARPSPRLRIGHPSGRAEVAVEAVEAGGDWQIRSATLRRSARLLMDGVVIAPGGAIEDHADRAQRPPALG